LVVVEQSVRLQRYFDNMHHSKPIFFLVELMECFDTGRAKKEATAHVDLQDEHGRQRNDFEKGNCECLQHELIHSSAKTYSRVFKVRLRGRDVARYLTHFVERALPSTLHTEHHKNVTQPSEFQNGRIIGVFLLVSVEIRCWNLLDCDE
jgi:hypothetical protein